MEIKHVMYKHVVFYVKYLLYCMKFMFFYFNHLHVSLVSYMVYG